jgi:hypothetical protein
VDETLHLWDFKENMMWLLGLLGAALAGPCHGTPNTLPLVTDQPVLVSSVRNAQLFSVSGVSPPLLVAHVWGAAGRERGRAYGLVLRPVLRTVYDAFFEWIDSGVEEAVLKYVPKDIAELVAIYGVRAVLDLQFDLMVAHMSKDFVEELRGVAETSGLSFREMARVTVFPDLVRAHCTMVGAWGSATTPEYSDSLVQLRALDWATNSPLQQWPLVTVYHTSSGGFSTLGWPMFLGALTGMSSSPVGVCEKVFLAYNGTDTRNGIPFTLMLRDILEFDTSVDEALKRMESVKRTCSVWVGVGAPSSLEKFTVVQYDREFVRHFNDSNLEASNPQHPQLPDVVYVDKHVQPSTDPCLGSLLQDAHGAITPEMLVRVASVHETGDTHVAVYDFLRMEMLVSNASPFVNNSVIPAYDRAFVRLDMKALFQLEQ